MILVGRFIYIQRYYMLEHNEHTVKLCYSLVHDTDKVEEVNNIEKKEETQIHETRAENIHISKNDLSLKEYLLKGNEYLYRKEYSDAIKYYAIKYYDKAIVQITFYDFNKSLD